MFEGDSLTEGWTGSMNYEWVSKVGTSHNWRVVNLGRGSQTCYKARSYATSFPPSQPSAPRGTLVIWIGTNDISNGSQSGHQLFSCVREYAQARRRLGWSVVVTTLQSIHRYGTTEDGDLQREVFNSLLRMHWTEFADALADFSALPEIDADAAWRSTKFFPDQKYLSAAGYDLVWPVMQAAVLSNSLPAPTNNR